MYVSVTRVNTDGLPPETSTIVAQEVHRWLDDIEGFEGFLMLAREGTTLSVSFWESREVAERHRLARAQVRERATAVAGAEIEDVFEYEVVYARLGPRLIEPRG
jgi:heme-degrading monooxygenase HmoA